MKDDLTPLQKLQHDLNTARQRIVIMRSKLDGAEARIAELTLERDVLVEALHKAHDAMTSWFSSEYAAHALSHEVAAALALVSASKVTP